MSEQDLKRHRSYLEMRIRQVESYFTEKASSETLAYRNKMRHVDEQLAEITRQKYEALNAAQAEQGAHCGDSEQAV